MPRFFDDYSNTYLTHDSAAGRKQQRRGWKFRENFKLHYENYLEDWRKGAMGLAAAQQGYIRAKGKDDPMIPPLPDGWKEDVDECTGISFYYNDETGTRTWVRPGFIPPPPGRGPPPMRGGPPPPGSYRPGGGAVGGGGFQHRGPPGAPPPPFGNRPQFGGGPPPPPHFNNAGLPPPHLHQVPPPFAQAGGLPPPQQVPPPFPLGGPPPPLGGFGNPPQGPPGY